MIQITYVKKKDLKLNVKNVLFNSIHETANNVANTICLTAKYYLYRVRCEENSMNCVTFEFKLKRFQAIEKYNAIKFGKLKKYKLKWHNVSIANMEQNEIRDQYIADYIDQM